MNVRRFLFFSKCYLQENHFFYYCNIATLVFKTATSGWCCRFLSKGTATSTWCCSIEDQSLQHQFDVAVWRSLTLQHQVGVAVSWDIPATSTWCCSFNDQSCNVAIKKKILFIKLTCTRKEESSNIWKKGEKFFKI